MVRGGKKGKEKVEKPNTTIKHDLDNVKKWIAD